jgi:methionine-rich copper-binding protein CopC
VCICLALASFSMPERVLAQSIQVIRTIPADQSVIDKSPGRAQIWFSARLDATRSTLSVYNDKGRQVDLGSGGVDASDPDLASLVVILPHLANGIYSVHWHAVFADGASGDGQYTFTITSAVMSTPPIAANTEPTNRSSRLSLSLLLAGMGVFVVVLSVVFYFALRQKVR